MNVNEEKRHLDLASSLTVDSGSTSAEGTESSGLSDANSPAHDYRAKLRLLLVERQARNPNYSLRAFSRDLGISTTALFDVLKGRRHLSGKNARKVAARLGLSPLEVARISAQIQNRDCRDGQISDAFILQDDLFRLISDWYYFAILNLAKLPTNQASAQWVADRLGLELEVAGEAIARLVRLEYLKISEGKLIRLAPPLQALGDGASSARRKYHRELLKRATTALDTVPMELREITAVTMAVDPRKLAEAKRRIFNFKEELSTFLESGEVEDVYMLTIQLIPALVPPDEPDAATQNKGSSSDEECK